MLENWPQNAPLRGLPAPSRRRGKLSYLELELFLLTVVAFLLAVP